jgi:predicted transposase/invertase (TIGR01784 family)
LDKLAKAVGDESILDWLRFLDCDEVESMEAIAEKNKGVRRAMEKYKALTDDKNARILEELREKDRRLEKGRLDYARDEGIAEAARRMADAGMSNDKIAEILGDI